jgi:hypothetical protein
VAGRHLGEHPARQDRSDQCSLGRAAWAPSCTCLGRTADATGSKLARSWGQAGRTGARQLHPALLHCRSWPQAHLQSPSTLCALMSEGVPVQEPPCTGLYLHRGQGGRGPASAAAAPASCPGAPVQVDQLGQPPRRLQGCRWRSSYLQGVPFQSELSTSP